VTINPDGESCGHVQYLFECYVSMTLLLGIKAGIQTVANITFAVGLFLLFSLMFLDNTWQGLTLVHSSAQPQPFMTQPHHLSTPQYPLTPRKRPLNTP
jgi:hypothetical protein